VAEHPLFVALERRPASVLPEQLGEHRRERESSGWLDDCPDGLAELRGVLLREHALRQREGLV
jgi:hypothetical protein